MGGGGDRWESLRLRAHELLEEGSENSTLSRLIDVFLSMLILANVIAVVLETEAQFAARYGAELVLFERISIVIFTLEYLLRVWSATAEPQLARMGPVRGRLAFMGRAYSLIDLIAILPYYLSAMFAIDLRILRVLRILRILKLARFSPALATLGRVLEQERHALFAALVMMLCLLVISGAVIHHLEGGAQPEKFSSIGAGMWWALATLTTVGYGDLAPVTPAGRVFGGLVMICGLGLFAIPIAVISSSFQEEIRRRDFVVTWGMVARVPAFAEVEPTDVAEMTRLLSARRFRQGARIARRGEPTDEMYFVLSGEVALLREDGETRLTSGDSFGQSALEEDGAWRADARAATDTQLLTLERSDLHELLRSRPHMRAAIERGLAAAQNAPPDSETRR